ncbi:DUF305 domain-containing protein [Actinotalea sp. Marseille-Q4924]|uniref:DUF305 domain-containing protein n=1 Tax=Actinotalea sp. Marseille-Q4924 TaxID=2866571 RepID=UPI001CE49D15|nr:DUF305 domain-containing protein [Actinotalea sp. Marseille-Q4924]
MTEADRPGRDDTGGTVPAGDRPGGRRLPVAAAAVLAGVVGLLVGALVAGVLLRPDTPAATSVDAGFAREMQVHHGQAVQMSVLVRERTDDPAVRSLALDILLTQQNQQGQMAGWLQVWGLAQTAAGPPMQWMSEHDGHGSGPDGSGPPEKMPGLVSAEQLALLEAAEGREAERLFLALMIPHHQGGVEMAEYAATEASTPAVRRLASSIVTAQEAEMVLLEEMLAERGGAPSGV